DPEFSLAQLFGPSGPLAAQRPRFEAVETTTHDQGISSFTFNVPERIDWPAFTLWLSALLHRHGDRILRVKGLVRTSAGANPVVIHCVQHSMHPPVHLVGPDDGQKSFLVFITRELDKRRIEDSLTRFLKLGDSNAQEIQLLPYA